MLLAACNGRAHNPLVPTGQVTFLYPPSTHTPCPAQVPCAALHRCMLPGGRAAAGQRGRHAVFLPLPVCGCVAAGPACGSVCAFVRTPVLNLSACIRVCVCACTTHAPALPAPLHAVAAVEIFGEAFHFGCTEPATGAMEDTAATIPDEFSCGARSCPAAYSECRVRERDGAPRGLERTGTSLHPLPDTFEQRILRVCVCV